MAVAVGGAVASTDDDDPAMGCCCCCSELAEDVAVALLLIEGDCKKCLNFKINQLKYVFFKIIFAI